MKLILFVASLLSFVFYRAAKTEVSLQGTWKGCYIGIEKNEAVTIVVGKNNNIELYTNEIQTNYKASGFCRVNNSNDVVINCNLNDAGKTQVSLAGRLNPDNNFVEGNWESDDQLTGSFYLSKEVSK